MDLSDSNAGQPVGAYGLRLRGLEAARDLLLPAPARWPTVRVGWSVGGPLSGPESLEDERAHINFPSGTGRVEIDRRRAEAWFTLGKPAAAMEIVHPYFPLVAAVWARWLGWEALHAGAFVVDGQAWALLGDKGSGKSSTLDWLAMQGAQILADDVLVLANAMGQAGPRCVERRANAARHLGIGENIGTVGVRERWRVRTGTVAAEVPLRGWVQLQWGREVSITPTPLAVRLPLLFENRALFVPPADPRALLALAALPAWQLSRPRTLESVDEATQRLLGVISAAAPPVL